MLYLGEGERYSYPDYCVIDTQITFSTSTDPQIGHQVSTSQNVIFHFLPCISGVYRPILFFLTLIAFSTTAGPPERSPGRVLA